MDRTAPATPTCSDARYSHVVLVEYGCVICQSYHRTGDALFGAHMHRQARNSYREIHADDAILEAARRK